jgi:hypothetical protein
MQLLMAVGRDTTACAILHDDGASWSAMTNGVPRMGMLQGVWGASANDVFAVGNMMNGDEYRAGGFIRNYVY